MTSRPPRSSSIPIPRSASTSNSARSIEALIPIPFVPPPARHIHATSPHSARPIAESRRAGLPDGYRSPTTGNSNVSTSPTRSTSRSFSLASSVPGRNPSRTRYEPRVGRSAVPVPPSTDLELPVQPSTSPSQVRRVSGTSLRASGPQKPIVPLHVVSRTTPVAFPRPSYLDYSSLRQLLQTEAPILPIPTRKVEVSLTSGGRNLDDIEFFSDEDDSSEPSTPPRPRALSVLVPSVSQERILKLPTRWSDQERNPHLSVAPDGRKLSFEGTSLNGDKDAASARTIHPIPPGCGIYYFEVEILGKDQKVHISIGFTGKSVKLSRLPGWEPNSWGYYGDDGSSLCTDKSGSLFGPSYGVGDTIGCGIDFTTYKVFYTKNGTLIGSAFDNVGKSLDLYPTVGLQHSGEAIRANFGQDPFKYDIDYHVQQQYNATWSKIMDTTLERYLLQGHRRSGFSIASITNDNGVKPSLTEEESKRVLKQLVSSYLVHHGYAKTVRALEKQQEALDREAKQPTLPDGADHDIEMNNASSKSNNIGIDIESRTNIVNAVLAGDIDTAIESTRTHYPAVLEVDDHLMLFKLRCRKFVELILETTEIKKEIKSLREREVECHRDLETIHDGWLDEEMNMDIDDDAPGPLHIRPTLDAPSIMSIDPTTVLSANDAGFLEGIASQYESALNTAITYGQALTNDYQSDPRPDVQQRFKKTLGIVAWEDPLEAGGAIAELVSHDARIALAHEINQAILKSQGRPAQPALETVYRHTAACINQLGLLGIGSAAFADMSREFLQQS
ncbi:SPRY-domain-containing protein [Pholiota conissans]|uniref:SPRY-domain-containing protein n=1 Tax=Pholiota conissans TaxID=109636 RepID=A0A9P6D0J8_9AGAR|nr:SPRY-domain-containing protein [Pholiota conissans]